MEAPSEKCEFICRESLAEKREEATTEGAQRKGSARLQGGSQFQKIPYSMLVLSMVYSPNEERAKDHDRNPG
jgi:hypothetical protein